MEQGKLLLMQMTPFLLNSPSPLFHEIPGLPVQHWDVPAAVWGWHVLLCSMSSFVFVFPFFCFLGFFFVFFVLSLILKRSKWVKQHHSFLGILLSCGWEIAPGHCRQRSLYTRMYLHLFCYYYLHLKATALPI